MDGKGVFIVAGRGWLVRTKVHPYAKTSSVFVTSKQKQICEGANCPANKQTTFCKA